jgi:hypothetical protein
MTAVERADERADYEAGLKVDEGALEPQAGQSLRCPYCTIVEGRTVLCRLCRIDDARHARFDAQFGHYVDEPPGRTEQIEHQSSFPCSLCFRPVCLAGGVCNRCEARRSSYPLTDREANR